MKTKELKTEEDFEQLKEGDYLAVSFKKTVTWDGKENYTFKVFPIYKVLKEYKEIVLQKKNNIYFLWEHFLNGDSHIKSVHLLIEENTKQISFDVTNNVRFVNMYIALYKQYLFLSKQESHCRIINKEKFISPTLSDFFYFLQTMKANNPSLVKELKSRLSDFEFM